MIHFCFNKLKLIPEYIKKGGDIQCGLDLEKEVLKFDQSAFRIIVFQHLRYESPSW